MRLTTHKRLKWQKSLIVGVLVFFTTVEGWCEFLIGVVGVCVFLTTSRIGLELQGRT